jgi:hypothetical protein
MIRLEGVTRWVHGDACGRIEEVAGQAWIEMFLLVYGGTQWRQCSVLEHSGQSQCNGIGYLHRISVSGATLIRAAAGLAAAVFYIMIVNPADRAVVFSDGRVPGRSGVLGWVAVVNMRGRSSVGPGSGISVNPQSRDRDSLYPPM